MKVRAVVPQKSLPAAKSRLAGRLPTAARAALSLTLLRTVCTALRASVGVEDVVVMSPDPEVRAQAAAWGTRAIPDPAPGLNGALAGALAQLAGRSHGILIVAADLPFLSPADIAALLAAGNAGMLALAPSREGGTNAMLVPPDIAFPPAYGSGSLAAHLRLARALGLGIAEVRRPGLAFDLDTEADLISLKGSRW